MSTLDRFVAAQSGGVFERALAEIRGGNKRSHWMWFVFPQIAGLGKSDTAQHYAIADRDEATKYIHHRMLGPRLMGISEAVLAWTDRKSVGDIFGPIDAIKLRSSMTLFETVASGPAPFAEVLDAFFGGERDPATVRLLSAR